MLGGQHSHVDSGHVDLILEQIDQLPTLSPIAVRVIGMTESGSADLREIAQLIESDPALTAKILSLCRRAERATTNKITTVNRAVVMLGLEAVQAALLSVEIFHYFANESEQTPPGLPALDRRELWRHMVGVACASELLAESRPDLVRGFKPDEVFLAGLLHDIGKLALDSVLPKAFGKVVAICERQQVNIAEVERRVLGIDHHVAGKRLAEHWGLPHALQDVIWLNGQPSELLPELPHRGLIGAVTVASALVRRLHLGWSGDVGRQREFSEICEEFGYGPEMVDALEGELQVRLRERVSALGLEEDVGPEVLLGAIRRANERLGRMARLLEERGRSASRQTTALAAISTFHERVSSRSSMTSVLADVVRSARDLFGEGSYAAIVQTRAGAPWGALDMGIDGRPASRWLVSRPEGAGELRQLLDAEGMELQAASVLTWLSEEFGGPLQGEGPRRLLPLERGAGGGLAAALVHDRSRLSDSLTEAGIGAIASTWGAAIVAAAQHEGARRLGERVSDINRELSEAQARLVDAESMARLGQLAAGAAHEMNNPLTVISGKAQLLASRLRNVDDRSATEAIVEASHKLTELITSLHVLADPPTPERIEVDVLGLLKDSAETAQRLFGGTHGVRIIREGEAPRAHIDPGQVGQAVVELVLNALQSTPRRNVEVRAQIDPLDDRLMISVADDGNGMSEHAIRHACDPFFSELPAGRRSGLGLTRARRFVELHGGALELESKQGRGTTARIVLPKWRSGSAEGDAREAA